SSSCLSSSAKRRKLSSRGAEGDTLLVPDRAFVAVAIPGRVSQKRTALELLGGQDVVSAYLASSSDERLFLGTSLQDQTFSQFLVSTPSRFSGLAVRVERRRSGRVTVAVLGHVTHLHTFDGLADFHFCPPSRAREPVDFRQLLLSQVDASSTSPLFIPPPLFCRFSQPANFRLDQLSVPPPSSSKGDAAAAVARALGVSTVPWAKAPQNRDARTAAIPAELASTTSSLCSSSSGSASACDASSFSGSKTAGDREAEEADGETLAAGRKDNVNRVSVRLEPGTGASETDGDAPVSGDGSRDEHKAPQEETGDAERLGARARSEEEKKVGEEFNAVARFGDAEFPSLPPPAAMKASADERLLSRLRHLLAEQPLWLRSSLDLHLPAEFTAWRKKPAYAKTCFLFADGPWRGCLCRLGYDPRLHPESRFSQTLDFRDAFFRNVNWRRLRNRKRPGTLPSLFPAPSSTQDLMTEEEGGSSAPVPMPRNVSYLEQHFLIAPTRPSLLYQLREIQDEGVQKLLREAPALAAPCKETGWFSAATMKTLRELLAMKSQRMREKGDVHATS
ncbi:RNA polymerase III transcription factor (TF)IIIC subunit, partial [Toxoplasma gondii p89]